MSGEEEEEDDDDESLGRADKEGQPVLVGHEHAEGDQHGLEVEEGDPGDGGEQVCGCPRHFRRPAWMDDDCLLVSKNCVAWMWSWKIGVMRPWSVGWEHGCYGSGSWDSR